MTQTESSKGTLVYDADCGFCTRSAEWLVHDSESQLTIAGWQSCDLDAIGLTEEMVSKRAYWVVDNKVAADGERAVAAALIAKGRYWKLIGRAIDLPVIRSIAANVYRFVARNRHRFPGGTPSCRMERR